MSTAGAPTPFGIVLACLCGAIAAGAPVHPGWTWYQASPSREVRQIHGGGTALWVISEVGISRIEAANDSCVEFLFDALPFGSVHAFHVGDSGDVLAATDSGLYAFAGDSWTKPVAASDSAPQAVLALDVDRNSHIWASCRSDTLYEFDGQTWVGHPVELTAQATAGPTQCVVAAPDGRVWATSSAGVLGFGSGSASRELRDTSWGYDRRGSVDIALGSDGEVYVLTTDGGVWRFDGSAWDSVARAPTAQPQCLAVDRVGVVYVASAADGLCRFDGNTWVSDANTPPLFWPTWPPSTIGQHSLWCSGSGMVYVADRQVIYHYDGTPERVWAKRWIAPDNAIPASVRIVVDDGSGNLYMRSLSTALTRFDGLSWTSEHLPAGFNAQYISDMAMDPAGRLVVGFSGGDGALLRRDSADAWTPVWNWSADVPVGTGATLGVKSIIYSADGRLWVSLSGGGILRQDGTAWTLLNSSNTDMPDVAAQNLYSLCADHEGAVWAVGGRPTAESHLLRTRDGYSWDRIEMPMTRPWRPAAILIDSSQTLWASLFRSDTVVDTAATCIRTLTAVGMLRKGIWTVHDSVQPTSGTYTYSVLAAGPAGDIWILGDDGVYWNDGSRWEHFTSNNSGLMAGGGSSVCTDKAGRAWIGGERGLSVCDLRVANAHPGQPRLVGDPQCDGFSVTNGPGTSLFIRYTLGRSAHIRLSLYDLRGRNRATIVDGRRDQGTRTFAWQPTSDDGRPLASGRYLLGLRAGASHQITRVVSLAR